MQESDRSVRFSHIGISLAESETIYSILNGTFHVLEDDQEYLFSDQSIAGTVKFSFPFPFSDSFFELFADGWFKLKRVLTDMKRRRGNKDLVIQFYFDGLIQDEGIVHFGLLFQLSNLNQKEFEIGLEKIEYHVDIIAAELSKMPERGSQYIYLYNPFRRKWIR